MIVSQLGTVWVFCMLICKSLSVSINLHSSDNMLSCNSSQLVIGKHYSPGPQGNPLKCYPPSTCIRQCCSPELHLTHHNKLQLADALLSVEGSTWLRSLLAAVAQPPLP